MVKVYCNAVNIVRGLLAQYVTDYTTADYFVLVLPADPTVAKTLRIAQILYTHKSRALFIRTKTSHPDLVRFCDEQGIRMYTDVGEAVLTFNSWYAEPVTAIDISDTIVKSARNFDRTFEDTQTLEHLCTAVEKSLTKHSVYTVATVLHDTLSGNVPPTAYRFHELMDSYLSVYMGLVEADEEFTKTSSQLASVLVHKKLRCNASAQLDAYTTQLLLQPFSVKGWEELQDRRRELCKLGFK